MKYLMVPMVVAFLSGCAPHIRAFTNSLTHSPLKSYRTFAVVLDPSQNTLVEKKIAQLLEHQMVLLGYEKSSEESADLHVAFVAQVFDAGVKTIPMPNFAYVPGQYTYYSTGAYSYTFGSAVFTGTTPVHLPNYKKVLAVIVVDREKTIGQTKIEKVWEAQTQEDGWCNKILATAPHIISAMFLNFGVSVTNHVETLWANDEGALRLIEREPYDLKC